MSVRTFSLPLMVVLYATSMNVSFVFVSDRNRLADSVSVSPLFTIIFAWSSIRTVRLSNFKKFAVSVVFWFCRFSCCFKVGVCWVAFFRGLPILVNRVLAFKVAPFLIKILPAWDPFELVIVRFEFGSCILITLLGEVYNSLVMTVAPFLIFR